MASTPHTSTARTRRSRLAGVARWTVIVLVMLALTGAATNAWLERLDDARFPPPGPLVSVGNHRLHLYCTGQGSPTVMLDAGLGGWSIGSERIRRALTDSVRVCVYDRKGLGWSEGGSGPNDIATSARELRALLLAANVPLPVVVVGHSLGANIAGYYAATYRGDVAGAVLLDPGTPEDMLEDFKGSEGDARKITGCGWRCAAAVVAGNLGLARLALHLVFPGTKQFSARENAMYLAGLSRARALRAMAGALAFLPKSAIEFRDARSFGDTPLTVIYSGNTRKPSGAETPADVAAWHALTLDRMRGLVAGSTRGRGPLIVPGVTHTSLVFDSASVALIASEVLRLARLPDRRSPSSAR